jgi:two-component system, chemotaxis family, chemotaxis protein CheY
MATLPCLRLLPSRLDPAPYEDLPMSEHQPSETALSLADVKVLIVDDTTLLLDVVEKSLRNLGLVNITRARDGEEALQQAHAWRPHLVFLDIEIPRPNGLEALKALKATQPDIFVCMLSAYSSVKNVRAALAAGASAFLVKPVHEGRLAHVVQQFQQGRRSDPMPTPEAPAT